ncbi:MAG: hypothetical protein ABR502_01720 [Chitinophagaceae bacterium]
MKLLLLIAIPVICWFFILPETTLSAYSKTGSPSTHPSSVNDLFGSDEVLHFKLSGNIRQLFADRGEVPAYHPVVLSYRKVDSNEVSVSLKAKTRGNFRRDKSNCTYPPILLNFQKIGSKSTLFENQDKLKMVMPCKEESHVIREYLVYKLYNILTPKSFRARLAKVNFYDAERKRETALYTMLLEEDEQMAKRNRTLILNKKMMRGESTETETFLKMAVFQYMIGNTDWSVEFLHNIRIMAIDSFSIPSVVPYDFDHAGIVNAPYALPAEELALRSTQHRRFRGYCITDWRTMDEVIATFNRLKKEFYNVYTNCTLLDAKYINATIKFLDGFYATINDAKKMRAEFTYPCNNPNIIIKGLGKD